MDLDNLQDKKIVVTGGSGFLGCVLTNRLNAMGAEVYSFDVAKNTKNRGVQITVDITDVNKLQKEVNTIKPNFIFHLAAKLDRDRDFNKLREISEVNFNGTVNILNALKDLDFINFIFASTSEVYGVGSKKASAETDQVIAASPYSLSKLNAENAIKTFSRIYNKNYTILRLFNFYGNNMPSGFFISDLVEKLKKNEEFDMTHGEQKRDFLPLESVVEALILGTREEAQNKTYNVCSGKGLKIKDIALKYKDQLDSKSVINFGAIPYRENEIWEMIGDNYKIKEDLGWEPKPLF
ncbi:MAG: NAD(P)-dependent oxidoreductase [Nonlabens sp.]